MKFKRTVILLTVVVAMGLMLGASAAQAATVERDGAVATAIRDMTVNGVTYDVVFCNADTEQVYGDPPVFDFPNLLEADAAVTAVTNLLTAEGGITVVGATGPDCQGSDPTKVYFGVAYREERVKIPLIPEKVHLTFLSFGIDQDEDAPGIWTQTGSAYHFRVADMYAKFTVVEPVAGDVSKVAAEGDILPDGTVLTAILKDGGVAINFDGQVAFGGRDDDGTDAAFTQAGKVAAEGDTLTDGTVLSTFRAQGELAIGGVQPDERVAFHGQDDNKTVGVFTQAGRVAAEGDTLADGTTLATLDEIDAAGKVAINNFDQVAFHGKIETEGAIAGEKFRAVFISDGKTTRLVAREGTDPPVGPPLAEILESGGVAISDSNEVAFHGRVVNPDFGGDSLEAVFSTDGLVAWEASELPDGTTLDDINADGGVAINLFEEVAFHGSVVDAGAGSDAVKAVLTGEVSTGAEVVVKEGDTLPDGTTVDEINVHSGVAINVYGDVVFHGRTGGVKAVFTQNGLVAKVGDTLADGTTTLKEIWEDAGVAINPYGFEVAFHGKVDSTDAVFVGLAP
jgi:hypothetical protein